MDRRTFFEKFAICLSAFFGFLRIGKVFAAPKEKRSKLVEKKVPKEFYTFSSDGRRILTRECHLQFPEPGHRDWMIVYSSNCEMQIPPPGFEMFAIMAEISADGKLGILLTRFIEKA